MGSSLCLPYTCQHGAGVDHLATHGFSCKKSEGHHYLHGTINDIIHRALTTACIPSRLKPSGLECTDGKRPDGVMMIPWKNGKPIILDATYPDTLSQCYHFHATNTAGTVANLVEESKSAKYISLGSGYSFIPADIENLGAIGKRLLAFLKELGHMVRQCTGSEGKDLPSSASLCSCSEKECSSCVGLFSCILYMLLLTCCCYLPYLYIYS